MARMLGRRLSAVICISYAVRDTMLRLGVDPDNLHVIHNGLASERVAAERPADAVRAEAAMGNGRPVIGMVGNIKEWKGQHVVVQALPAIRARFPEVICLLVGDSAAADRPFDERLRGMIRDLGVGDTVRFTGYQRNVADYVALFDVAIHASTDPEPFGRVLLEAMALSKPLVAARAGAVPEIVVDGETGFSFTPGDSGDLAARVIWLLEHPDEAERLGNAGLRRLKDEFHVSTNARRTQELYARALQPGEASA
jgi:glycosyltransferase involved in cell wall biosynthesis